MGVATAGMLERKTSPFPDVAWRVAFALAVAVVWFAGRAILARAGRALGRQPAFLTATKWMGAVVVNPDLIDRALRRFLVLGQAMRRDAEALPVSVAQSAVLSRLRGGPKTVGELATAEGVRAPSMTQIINRMEEAGWVIRSEGPVRGRTVQITEAGLAVAVAVRQERVARLARRCEELSAGDQAALEAVLPVLDRIFGDPLSY